MTLNNLLPPVHIHPILLIFIIISFLTGTFIELMTILVIVLIHELGHFTAAKWFGWRIRGIMLWVFGGVMQTDENGTRPFHEEVVVTIAGPIQHLFIYLVLFFLSGSHAVLPSIVEMGFFYNTVILLFNLLPIWPLDGGKLVLLLFSELFPYRKAYDCAIILSICINMIVIVALLLLVPFTLSAFLLFTFLLMENGKDWKHRYYVFMRFLLQRYQGKNHFNRIHTIEVTYNTSLMDVFNRFRRDKNHTVYVTFPGNTRQSMSEAECLYSYFHERNYRKPIGELVSYVS
ncbi:site-2 protease family protein [Lentibacillus sp. CBA3610]|uniref:site-2 protease family protein n=1 Tax=Lentibacillus sp. CBA3610 TaxID=2518176 RepID=UPI001595F650|nr:site-2 protease family protein [Lentibacillus sp. CBA3610]QKY69576.1 stage IV sporulation protein FB [Lentibacillus sp. CBA3610]